MPNARQRANQLSARLLAPYPQVLAREEQKAKRMAVESEYEPRGVRVFHTDRVLAGVNHFSCNALSDSHFVAPRITPPPRPTPIRPIQF